METGEKTLKIMGGPVYVKAVKGFIKRQDKVIDNHIQGGAYTKVVVKAFPGNTHP